MDKMSKSQNTDIMRYTFSGPTILCRNIIGIKGYVGEYWFLDLICRVYDRHGNKASNRSETNARHVQHNPIIKINYSFIPLKKTERNQYIYLDSCITGQNLPSKLRASNVTL